MDRSEILYNAYTSSEDKHVTFFVWSGQPLLERAFETAFHAYYY